MATDPSPPADNSATVPDPRPRTAGSAARRGGLGRGLGALIPTPTTAEPAAANLDVDIDGISPNPYQPRAEIDPDKLQILAASIRTHGIIQPLIVTYGDAPDRYVLIAGERRWRAARQAGLRRIPVVIKDAAPQAMLELALVENVARADLSPLEEAAAYRQLIDEFHLTQANIAERVGRSRVSVTNTLRLLTAPEPIQAALNAGQITEGHARALLGLTTAVDQIALLEDVLRRGLTVRQTEEAVRRWLSGDRPKRAEDAPPDAEQFRLEDRFRTALGTRVTFKRHPNGTGGSLTIHCFSDEELGALYERLVGEEVW